MILVVDTNIVFSALLNPKSKIAELLLDIPNNFKFYAPELLLLEIEKYNDKIIKYAKLEKSNLAIIKTSIFNKITFISEELISEKSWKLAYNLLKNIDENDTPFIALSLELNAKLWTGDKKLSDGLVKKGKTVTITTEEMKNISNL